MLPGIFGQFAIEVSIKTSRRFRRDENRAVKKFQFGVPFPNPNSPLCIMLHIIERIRFPIIHRQREIQTGAAQYLRISSIPR